ncbi:hypothetical protein SOCE26_005840 [Sorangium cellulosum]|uniref:DUF4139 domain-containing protein n=1 Tax=Sorangium cellulosum TaxID=56 RepID=A0A2L0EIT0_SORCE|nr:DUF4139 domain-containing protein [Sorangium cellulosum]AUX39202.1 hypothetical protein SOCE26_005840 [Sorangium cellulosum]
MGMDADGPSGSERSTSEEGAGERTPPAGHPSAARVVTLFEDRAEVVRVARVEVGAGAQWVAIGGVSVFVDERTVQARAVAAEGAGAVRVTAARVRWRAHREAALGREEIDALEREQREASRRAAAAELARDRAARREAHVDQLLAKWAQALGAVPKDAGEPERIASWRAGYEALDAALAEALGASADAREARAHAEDDARRAAARLREGSRERPRFEAVIEVEVHAPAPQPVEIELTYRVACAVWRPEHLARLSAGSAPGADAQGGRGAVELTTWAAAWQATGEVWENVTARFSTARPSRNAEAPILADDVLQVRRKTELERRRVVVEARDQAIAAAGLDRGARAVDEMPGVDDGGEPLTFEATEPVTLPSNGRPLRIEVARRSLPAELALVLYPEAHPAAHVRATVTLDGGAGSRPHPLLAGPVRVARGGSLIGRARLDFVGAGEPFELGFGVDDAVRVRRTVDEEHDTSAITGSRKIRRKVKLSLSNLSSDTKRVLVTERIPVSEVAEVEIALGEAPGWTLDEKDGFLRGQVELPPKAVKTMSFSYDIRASASVVLPF